MTLSEYIDLMLEGAALTGEYRGWFSNEDDTKTCALGAVRYGLAARNGMHIEPTERLWLYAENEELDAAEADAITAYHDAYGKYISIDNDTHGRDHVIKRLKELL